jgi:hypothetical protein
MRQMRLDHDGAVTARYFTLAESTHEPQKPTSKEKVLAPAVGWKRS